MSYREACATHFELSGVLQRLDRLIAAGGAEDPTGRARVAQQLIDVVRQRAGTLERPVGHGAEDQDWAQGRRRGAQAALRIVTRTVDTSRPTWIGETRQAFLAAAHSAAIERAERAREGAAPTHDSTAPWDQPASGGGSERGARALS
jgi:hypothetical protein